MQTSDENIYAVGECAEIEEINFRAGHVKECTMEADCAISHILQKDVKEFERKVSIDMLKVGEFDLVDVRSPTLSFEYEKVVIESAEDNRIDEYIIHNDSLKGFLGINSNVDVGYLESVIESGEKVDINYLFENRVVGKRGRLICSCEHVYHKDIVDIVVETGISSFSELGEFFQDGRVGGRCKKMVEDLVEDSQYLVDPNMPRKSAADLKREKEIAKVQKRIDKFNKLHPRNSLTTDNLESAMESLDIAKHEVNSWVSMVTANMKLHPNFEEVVEKGVKTLNKVTIVWFELADCSGNSEAFIKTTNSAIEDLIFAYIYFD